MCPHISEPRLQNKQTCSKLPAPSFVSHFFCETKFILSFEQRLAVLQVNVRGFNKMYLVFARGWLRALGISYC